MNVWYWRYELVPLAALSAVAAGGARQGALVRIGSGFGDIHPWPELGDQPLDRQLELLARGELTPLTRRTLELARVDADAREGAHSAFEGMDIPDSHWPGPHAPAGFDTVKIKCGPDLDPATLPDGVRLRLDFNNTLDAATFERLADRLPADRIDFVEDPFPYDEAGWRQMASRTGLRMALDRGSGIAADVVVVKPAVQDFPDQAEGEVVVTSYMDHPLGQLGAAWVAALHCQSVSPRCGLMTHVLYEKDPFIEQMSARGASLIPPGGTGFGFDDLLGRAPWKKLR